jgi:hypothetical protein
VGLHTQIFKKKKKLKIKKIKKYGWGSLIPKQVEQLENLVNQ